jgi:hypothetical protein
MRLRRKRLPEINFFLPLRAMVRVSRNKLRPVAKKRKVRYE